MRVVAAITGASGLILGERVVEELAGIKAKVYVIISDGALKIREYEPFNLEKVESLSCKLYREDELDAEIASSSFNIDSMIIAPCSMKTLSSIANGFSDNLVSRAAENVLKLNKKLVVAPRDTPLSLNAIENMRKLKLQDALIVPPNMAYYYKPESIDDITNFFVGKLLDSLGVENKLYRRWGGTR
ncbi:MAG: aromatic acid decarboxylase [Candidatus Altiarchaeales archaeon ex4484_2]|nr:MAG: aromatic acid decarboxylase [Candidatus Altiarchaeales archaeon ex4484_2]